MTLISQKNLKLLHEHDPSIPIAVQPSDVLGVYVILERAKQETSPSKVKGTIGIEGMSFQFNIHTF